MQRYVKFLVVPGVAIAMACGSDDRKVDESLSRDLSLAGQAAPQQQYVSPVEQQGYQQGYANPAPARRASAPAPARRTTAPRTSTTSAGTVEQSSGRVVVEKNTKRDAIIGATAGAVIGAATSKDKVKGAVIGGAAGAILGGVIGNNVDIKKRRVP